MLSIIKPEKGIAELHEIAIGDRTSAKWLLVEKILIKQRNR
jgi:hypothetical protein